MLRSQSCAPPPAVAPLRHLVCPATATPDLIFLAKHLPGGGELAGDAHGTLDQREQLHSPLTTGTGEHVNGASVSIDGRTVAQLKASGLRRFDVAPGEHIVRFRVGDAQTETVVRVRVNEQTVVRHQAEAAAPVATPSPLPSASR